MQISQNAWERHHYRFGLAGEGQADIIQKYLTSRSGVILDIGCGFQGQHVASLASLADGVVAVDDEREMVFSARADGIPSNAYFAVADVKQLPFVSQAFGAVVALGLFAYITNPGPVFAELNRVIRQGGLIMLTNAVVHAMPPLLDAARQNQLHLVEQAEGYCPAASGAVKRRYLCVFQKP